MSVNDSADTAKYVVTLRDVNGITIGGTTYKVANGDPIDMHVLSVSDMFKNNILSKPIENKNITTTTTWNSRKGYTTYSSVENPAIELRGALLMSDYALSDRTISSTTIKHLTWTRLFRLATTPGVFYLKDFTGTGGNAPIKELQAATDIFGNAIYGTNGIPVVVASVDINRDAEDMIGDYIPYSMKLIEDRI